MPNLEFVNVAIAATPGTMDFYVVTRSDPGDPAWLPQIGSLSLDHLLKCERDPDLA